MDEEKRRRLESAGWSVGDVSDFLDLSPAVTVNSGPLDAASVQISCTVSPISGHSATDSSGGEIDTVPLRSCSPTDFIAPNEDSAVIQDGTSKIARPSSTNTVAESFSRPPNLAANRECTGYSATAMSMPHRMTEMNGAMI